MDAETRGALLPELLALAQRAGDAIRAIYGGGFRVRNKADASPLTDADQASHELIAEGLSRLTPGVPLLSEESPLPAWGERRQWQRYWLVDPLDGTREFVRRNDQFSVNIALVEGDRPVLGVIHAPIPRLNWFGGPGLGAWRASADQPPVAIRPRLPPSAPLRVVLGGSHPGPRTRRLLARLPHHRLLVMGASLKFCMVAEGDADLFPRYGPISEWDLAAAQAILEAAGGRLLRMRDLQPMRYNRQASTTVHDVLAIGDLGADWPAVLGPLT